MLGLKDLVIYYNEKWEGKWIKKDRVRKKRGKVKEEEGIIDISKYIMGCVWFLG